MGRRGPYPGVTPGNGDAYRNFRRFGKSECRRCGGNDLVQKTLREISEDDEQDALHLRVFGPEEVGFVNAPYRAPVGHKWCTLCHPFREREDLQPNLRALRVLADRTERGEKFTREQHGGDFFKNLVREMSPPKRNNVKPKKTNNSLSEQLTQLAALRKTGALTAKEFKLAKQRLLESDKE